MALFPTSEQGSAAPQSSIPSTAASQPIPQEPITISLDGPEPVVRKSVKADHADEDADATTPPARRAPLRRDSMQRREALLKGKEGTRRRQRWENDNFLNNPSYVPPTADDFQPRPLYPTRVVRYDFASLWDPSNPKKYGYGTAHHIPSATKKDDEKRVPKPLKDRLKRSKGAMDLLKSLEEEVRRYAATLWGCADEHWGVAPASAETMDDDLTDKDYDMAESTSTLQKSIVEDEMRDSEDEEIVFIPRMQTVTVDDSMDKKTGREIYIPVLAPPLEKSVFETLDNDQGASFGRWLVHSIALYYGLRSWSVTRGNPAMRVAFVGAQPSEKKRRRAGALVKRPKTLPRPLWMML